MTDVATLDRNECRCGHDEYEHDEEGLCMSETRNRGGYIERGACDCAGFKEPDDGRGQA